MAQRLDLHAKFKAILGSDNVYFQPPPDLKLKYPCILYERDYNLLEHGDNGPYKHRRRYKVTVIDRDPDSVIPDQVLALPFCTFDRFFTADNLNHDTYKLFF